MSHLRKLLAVVALGSAVGLAGCGSDSDNAPRAVSPAARTAPAAPIDAGVTEGRIGDATVADAGSGQKVIGHGKPLRPSDANPKGPDREGVGAGVDCPATNDVPTAETLAAASSATLCLVNGVRTDRGLTPLTENATLAAAATAYAKAMVTDRFFSHTGADGSSLTDRIAKTGFLTGEWLIGENLAWGSGVLSTPQAILTAWMNSEGHRANILNPDFRQIGLGAAFGTPTGSATGATLVHEFGVNTAAPSESDDAAAASTTTRTTPQATKRTVPCSKRSTAKARKACRAAAARKARAARRARAARLARAAAARR